MDPTSVQGPTKPDAARTNDVQPFTPQISVEKLATFDADLDFLVLAAHDLGERNRNDVGVRSPEELSWNTRHANSTGPCSHSDIYVLLVTLVIIVNAISRKFLRDPPGVRLPRQIRLKHMRNWIVDLFGRMDPTSVQGGTCRVWCFLIPTCPSIQTLSTASNTPTSVIVLGAQPSGRTSRAPRTILNKLDRPSPLIIMYFWSPHGAFDMPQQLLKGADVADANDALPVTSQVSVEKLATFDADLDFLVLAAHDLGERNRNSLGVASRVAGGIVKYWTRAGDAVVKRIQVYSHIHQAVSMSNSAVSIAPLTFLRCRWENRQPISGTMNRSKGTEFELTQVVEHKTCKLNWSLSALQMRTQDVGRAFRELQVPVLAGVILEELVAAI
ncbi:hypothetical protein GGX14DRAFT_407651 [Mycena pura]|uniref:Uncharacterized protein n=1 Tax=Mycena pura TaxID=153505 RepID=A0AAD6URM6_9AGAR|nr:hypothetical protein GGX14DRAFT_407651 [Mycena pura]